MKANIKKKTNVEGKYQIVPINLALECKSKPYGDKNFQFRAISFFISNNISDWMLKTADPEFDQG